MKIYQSYIKTCLLALSMAILLPACSDYLDINEDPNNPTSVAGDYNLLLVDIAGTTAYNLVGGGNFTRYGAQFVQHITEVTEPPSEDTYRIETSDMNNEWAFYSYSSTLINCKEVIDRGSIDGSWNHVVIAKILMAHNFALLTDYWGDIPFSEALQRTGNLKPKYDSQETVYEGIQRLLDEAISDIAKGALRPANDLFLAGDMAKWRKVAFALKARYHMRLSNAPGKNAATQAQLALDALQNGMTSRSDEASFLFTGQVGAEGPWNQWITKFQLGGKISQYMLDMLDSKNDPRKPIYAEHNNAGQYVGHVNGASNITPVLASISSLGRFFLAPRARVPIMTYVEQKFIEAEANFRLGKMPEAAAAYSTAVKDHMSWLSGQGQFSTVIDEAAQNAYLAANPMNSLEDIMTQKYIAGFLLSSAEAYNDYRRTGFPSTLRPALNNTIGQIPTRIPYPDTELNNNAENVPSGVSLTSKVWWDGD